MKYILIVASISLTLFLGCEKSGDLKLFANEKHLRNIRMLTTEGENAEAYFRFDQKKLIFQSRSGDYLCDQIFTMDLDGSNKKLVSTGLGRTTCSFFFPDGKQIIYASTHADDPACPPPPDFSRGYVWKVYKSFELYTANQDGSYPSLLVPH